MALGIGFDATDRRLNVGTGFTSQNNFTGLFYHGDEVYASLLRNRTAKII